MTANARNSFGTKISRETATPDTYADIAELISVGDYDSTRETIDTTTHDSAGGYKDYIPAAFKDQADITVEVNFTGISALNDVKNDYENAVKKKWRITFPTATPETVTFEAYVTGFKVSAGDPSSQLKASFTLKPTGQPTWA